MTHDRIECVRAPAKLGRVLVCHQLERADVHPLLEGWCPLLGLKLRLLPGQFLKVQAHGLVGLHPSQVVHIGGVVDARREPSAVAPPPVTASSARRRSSLSRLPYNAARRPYATMGTLSRFTAVDIVAVCI